MKDGQKVEEGSHQELMEKNGEYKKLFELSQRS
jgi:ABC-type multidrug transport system fused ATPase/permease subunit